QPSPCSSPTRPAPAAAIGAATVRSSRRPARSHDAHGHKHRVQKHTVLPAALLVLSLSVAPACAQATSRTAAGTPSAQPPSVSLLDRSEASFQRWRHVGGGAFVRNADGSIETRGGPLGMLWYPLLPLRDVTIHLQWRDAAPRCCSNSGVFVRFPDPEAATSGPSLLPCQTGLAQSH